MQIPLKREIADRIELAMARFSRSWGDLDPLRRATAEKTVILAELLGGRGKASEVAGIADNTLDNYRHGKKDPKLRTLELMADKAGIASRYLGGDWLFDGNDVRIELSARAVASGYGETVPPGLMDSPSAPYLHGYDEMAPTAGSTAARMLEDYWLSLGLDPAAIMAIVAEGDSMEPTITGHSPVFVDTEDRHLDDGCIYAVKVGERIVIRRVQRLIDGSLQLLADNQAAYPPEKLGKRKIAELEVLGRVRSAAVAC